MLRRMTKKEKLMIQERGDDSRSISLSRLKWNPAKRMGSSTPMKETDLNRSGTICMI